MADDLGTDQIAVLCMFVILDNWNLFSISAFVLRVSLVAVGCGHLAVDVFRASAILFVSG